MLNQKLRLRSGFQLPARASAFEMRNLFRVAQKITCSEQGFRKSVLRNGLELAKKCSPKLLDFLSVNDSVFCIRNTSVIASQSKIIHSKSAIYKRLSNATPERQIMPSHNKPKYGLCNRIGEVKKLYKLPLNAKCDL